MELTDIILEGDDFVDNVRREWDKITDTTSSSNYFTLMGTSGTTPRVFTAGKWFPENGAECVASATIYNVILDLCEEIQQEITTTAPASVKQDRQFVYVANGDIVVGNTAKLYIKEV